MMEGEGKRMGKVTTKIQIELSNHHVHLSEEVQNKLFGDETITVKKYLNEEKTLFAADQTVTLKGPRGELKNVRLLGPCRNYTQAELLRSDCFRLGVEAPVRDSGDLEGAAMLTIVGPKGEVAVACGIIALRHIHMAPSLMEAYKLQDKQMVQVKIGGERALIFDNVLIRRAKVNKSVMHIDLEEGNAAGIDGGYMGEIRV